MTSFKIDPLKFFDHDEILSTATATETATRRLLVPWDASLSGPDQRENVLRVLGPTYTTGRGTFAPFFVIIIFILFYPSSSHAQPLTRAPSCYLMGRQQPSRPCPPPPPWPPPWASTQISGWKSPDMPSNTTNMVWMTTSQYCPCVTPGVSHTATSPSRAAGQQARVTLELGTTWQRSVFKFPCTWSVKTIQHKSGTSSGIRFWIAYNSQICHCWKLFTVLPQGRPAILCTQAENRDASWRSANCLLLGATMPTT